MLFTGLQETYVDTIDVVPSNFSITEGYSYSAPRRDASLNRSTVFVFRAAPRRLRIRDAYVAPFLDIRIFIRKTATGCKVLHRSSRASVRITIGELAIALSARRFCRLFLPQMRCYTRLKSYSV